VDTLVRSLDLDGPVATITAGWQEQELDYGDLSAFLDRRDVNLELFRRWSDVQDRDPEYAAGERLVQGVLADLHDTYLLRLDYALRAVRALQQRDGGSGPVAADALSEAVAAAADLDAAHLRRVNEVRGEFFEKIPPHGRPVIAEHRAAVAGLLSQAAAVVLAGGHVGVLAEMLHLFNVAASVKDAAGARGPGWPVIAWSAGAMALTDRIVLFHDKAPQGPGHPEVHGSGLSLVREVVALPHARARLLLDDTARMAVFARRFAPARCVLLEQGTRLDSEGGWLAGARVLGEDGHVSALAAA
jgi:hypothetical protein